MKTVHFLSSGCFGGRFHRRGRHVAVGPTWQPSSLLFLFLFSSLFLLYSLRRRTPPTPLPPASAGYAAPSLLPPRTTWRAAAMELELTGDGDGGGWVAKGRLGSFSEARRIMCARRPPGTRAAGGRQCGRRLIHGGHGVWMAGYMYISFFW